MTALCRARVSLDVPRCNAPASPASSYRGVPLCERCMRVADAVDARWGHKATSRAFIPAEFAKSTEAPKGPAKQSTADEELFAAMKRAMANGFARHEPAYDEPDPAREEAA